MTETDIKTDDKKTDENIELESLRTKYDKEIAEMKKAIEERDEKITKLQTYIADHVTQPDGMKTNLQGTKTESFNDKYKDLVKSLGTKKE